MSALERLAVAMSSSDLTLDDTRRDVDYIIAAGFSATRHGPVASSLLRLHASTSMTDLKAASASVQGLVAKLNTRRGWGLTQAEIEAVAANALAHHVTPACLACGGHGYELVPGTPTLSATPCASCHGTGRRPVQKKLRDEIQQTIGVLENIDSVTQRAVARLVR